VVTDKKGIEIKEGDEIIVRGRVIAVVMDLADDGKGILQVRWDEDVPLLDFVHSLSIEKA
jgi:hypothetical protein